MQRDCNFTSGQLGCGLVVLGMVGFWIWRLMRSLTPSLVPWGPATMPVWVSLCVGGMVVLVWVGVPFCLWGIVRRNGWKPGLAGVAAALLHFAGLAAS
jgi:hypothetical protein